MLGWDSNVSSWRLIVPAFIYLEVAQNLPNLACSTSKFLLFGLRSGQCWLGCGLALKAKKDVPFLDQEHLVRTRCGSVTVAVYGDEDRPALVTYPDVGLNCECHHRFYNLLITVMTGFCDHQPHMANMLLFFCWLGQTYHVSKDCSSARKLRLCCSTISASTTSILRGTRSVMPVQPSSCVMLGLC